MTKIDWNSMEALTVEELFESGYTGRTRVKIKDIPTTVLVKGRSGVIDRLDLFIMMNRNLPCISSSIRYNKENRAWALHLKQRENTQEVVLGGDFYPKKGHPECFLDISYIDIPGLRRVFKYDVGKKEEFSGNPTALILQPRQNWQRELHFNVMLDGTLPCIGNKFDYFKEENRVSALYLEEGIESGRKVKVVGHPYPEKRPQYLDLKSVEMPDLGIKITTSRF